MSALSEQEAVDFLLNALRDSSGSPPLSVLSYPLYPGREFMPVALPDGSMCLTLSKYGWHYKRRGKRLTKTPYPADTLAIQRVLNSSLPDSVLIRSVVDKGTAVEVIMEEKI